jgi:threonine dehydrogenase-like Zn-dependent dehydrogenase
VDELPGKLGNIDIIFEATGNSSVALKAMSILGVNGILCLTGVTGGNKRLEICADCLNLRIVLGNRVIFGTVNANKRHFKSGIEHMLEVERKWPHILEKMITGRVKFNDFEKAFRKGVDDIKVVIEF